MKRLLGLTLLLATPAPAETPLAIVTIDGFELHGWDVTCANVDSHAPDCRARREIAGGCLSLHFDRETAHAELLRSCDDQGDGPRQEIELPLDRVWGAPDAIEALLRAHAIEPGIVLTEGFSRDARYVAMFLYRITNG